MIYMDFLSDKDGRIKGFRAVGHSGFSEEGSDIVCAAVSSSLYMTVNTIVEVLKVTPKTLRVDDAEMVFIIEDEDMKKCRDFFEGLKIHLMALEEQYEDNINVNYLEV